MLSACRSLVPAGFLASVLSLVVIDQAQAQQSQPRAAASVTVYPVLLAGSASQDAASVLGILLERGGLQHVEVDAPAFTPDRGSEFADQASAFAAFVQRQGLRTDYALFADFLGVPGSSVSEVRGVLVDKQGAVLWSERQKAGEAAFERSKPHDPMECCVLLAQRLREPLRLTDPARGNGAEGALAKRWSQKAGVPPQAELESMRQRLEELRKLGSKATIKVYPPRVGSDWPAERAADLASRLAQRGSIATSASTEPLRFAAEKSTNEQVTLWSGARSIQKAVRGAPEQKDYLLFCDFMLAANGKAQAVHSYLLTPTGDLVVVDYQNSHHEDFQRVAPDSVAKCCELAALRIAGQLNR